MIRLFATNCLLAAVFAFTVAMSFAEAARAQAGAEPDLRQVSQHAAATLERLQREPATWTTTLELPTPGLSFTCTTVLSSGGRRMLLAFEKGGVTHELAKIIERDNAWYVRADGPMVKYRPYEAPLPMPVLYSFLSRCDLRLLMQDTLSPEAKFESLKGNVATYRTPLPESARKQLQTSLAAIAKLKQQQPQSVDPAVEQEMKTVERALEGGVPLEVQTDTGIILAGGAIGKQFRVRDFRWLEPQQVPELPGDLDQVEDHTEPLLAEAESPNDLFMIGHAAAWQPGGPKFDTDMVLADLRGGEIRRVPFPLGVTATGCFAKDRRSVFVSGQVPDEGSLGLFEINLENGNVRRLGEGTLMGLNMFSTLSPDGKTIAVAHKSGSEGVLEWQIHLVDVASGQARPIGRPFDTAFLSWLPDNSGIILVTRKFRGTSEPMEETIARMDLNGQITPIRPGSFPVVLSPQPKILFLDQADEQWKTCDLSGNGVSVVGDGLKGFNFPSASPDGQKVLMMRFGSTAGPRPYLVDVSSGESTPVELGQGLWVMPAWR